MHLSGFSGAGSYHILFLPVLFVCLLSSGCTSSARCGSARRPIHRQQDLILLSGLAQAQQPDGSWVGAGDEHAVPVTALALIAILSQGSSTKWGKYRDHLRRSADWLLQQQNEDGSFGRRGIETPLALFALTDLCGMSGLRLSDTADPIVASVERAINYGIGIQEPDGGWRYEDGVPDADRAVPVSMLSAFWCFALKSSHAWGAEVPQAVYLKALQYCLTTLDQSEIGSTKPVDDDALLSAMFVALAANMLRPKAAHNHIEKLIQRTGEVLDGKIAADPAHLWATSMLTFHQLGHREAMSRFGGWNEVARRSAERVRRTNRRSRPWYGLSGTYAFLLISRDLCYAYHVHCVWCGCPGGCPLAATSD